MHYGIFEISIISIIVAAISGYISGIVKSDKKARLLSLLPKLDCMACGKKSCVEYVDSIISGEKNLKPCFPILYKEEFKIIEKEFDCSFDIEKDEVAQIMCAASINECGYISENSRFSDCHSIFLNNVQLRECENACLMAGSCVEICPSDAIRMSESILKIDNSLCTGCGLCISECPIDLIKLIPRKSNFIVACSNKDKGSQVHKYCSVGCLGCDVCSKVCPEDAIIKLENLVYINQEKCINCELCAIKCPTNSIVTLRKEAKFAIIDESNCNGCGICDEVCPVEAIEGKKGELYRVIEQKCIGCGICIPECPKGAIDERIYE